MGRIIYTGSRSSPLLRHLGVGGDVSPPWETVQRAGNETSARSESPEHRRLPTQHRLVQPSHAGRALLPPQ